MADVVCCRDREAVGEDGGELPEHEGEAAPTRGRPCLPRRHLLQIQELSQTLPGASSKVAQHGCCLEEEREEVEHSERIKTRQRHLFFLESRAHTFAAENQPVSGR